MDMAKPKWLLRSGRIVENGKYSVMRPFPVRYLIDLGAEPYQEFLTLILKPRIAFPCGYLSPNS